MTGTCQHAYINKKLVYSALPPLMLRQQNWFEPAVLVAEHMEGLCALFQARALSEKCLTHRHCPCLELLEQLKWINTADFLSLLPFSTLVLPQGISATAHAMEKCPVTLWGGRTLFVCRREKSNLPKLCSWRQGGHGGLCYQDLLFTGLSSDPLLVHKEILFFLLRGVAILK